MNAQPAVAVLLVASTFAATAQTSNVKPPQAQAWIDVATYSGMGMPGMGAAGGNPLGALGGLFGGGAGAAKNSFGQTQTGAAGRWVDVTLMTRANPSLAEAQQAVPAGFLSPALKLQSPKEVRTPAPRDDDDKVVEQDYERPKGKLLLYWGCGATVRPGQPKVLDMATASATDMAKFFVSRRATQRGAHSAVGRPVWPSPADERMVPDNASLVGEHQFSGSGVPEGFRFQIQAAQDLMPALQMQQVDQGGATDLTWAALPTARAYFIAGMGAAKQDEMVIWTSSEVPEAGFGLIDYQTNAAVDRWLKEKVLLAPATTHCTVPKGVFPGQGGMLRAIAYGNELNLAHPPRPADPKAVWEPVWAAKLRVKSVATVMLGMPQMGQMPPAGTEPAPKPQPEEKKEDKMPKPLDLLKGILGR
ncbi:hypothetical protein [Piscinibacter sp.]|uniref:hypothetical protein n=1 Tax=Piscinibacter sp. TaxID=1903157 RepID=UPI001DB88C79|nr:hypothetical protein [Piscinibacter sp.]MBK7532910.1 hypothetical protein [Piscinibacter sp.]